MSESKTNFFHEGSMVPRALWLAGLYGVALLLIFRDTTWSLISIWSRSDTFAHGFLILPISLWVAWNEREKLRSLIPSPILPVAALMIPVGIVWLLGALVDVLVVQQLALVTLLVLGIWVIVGNQLGRALAFPLFFLFFAVPMGEGLIAPMMEFTATSTVWLIQQTGIPVYREGLFFTLPSGRWSVVEACSGVRYIIASVTLGVLYAHLTYTSWSRRLIFVVISAIVPVFANTARAYIIVMLGHVSDMSIATGADHLLYGWVFFGLVIFLLFWLGAFFREDHTVNTASDAVDASNSNTGVKGASALHLAATISLLVALLGPAVFMLNEQSSGLDSGFSVTMPDSSGAWTSIEDPQWAWQPYNSSAVQQAAYYANNGETLGLFVQYTAGNTKTGEVVGSSTRFVGGDSDFLIRNRGKTSVRLEGEGLDVDHAQVAGPGGAMLAWSWYRIGNMQASNDYLAKLLEAKASIGLGDKGSFRIVIAVPLSDTVGDSEALLSSFLGEHGGRLIESLSYHVGAEH